MKSSIVLRFLRMVAITAAAASAANPLVAQGNHTTAPPVHSWAVWMGAVVGHRIWVSNDDSVPVVVTKMRISHCVNIQTPCRDSIPEVRILAPKEGYSITNIFPVDPKQPFSYGFAVDWRIATECVGLMPQLPADAASGAVTVPEMTSLFLPPGPYVDKQVGPYTVRFFVAWDGTTDSAIVSGIPPGRYRDIVQGIFKGYLFRPAHFRGCPIPSTIQVAVSHAPDVPKPTAYEGFPPTPSELQGDTRGPRNPTSPREPYIVLGACPFECCQFGEWQANATTQVYSKEGSAHDPLFALHRGDSVRATTGNVHTLHVGRVGIVGKLTSDWATYDEHLLPLPAIGDTVYVLSYEGEGVWRYWYHGLVGEGEQLWGEGRDSVTAPGRMLVNPVSQWWVHVIDRRKRSGWLIVPSAGFGGYDACG